MSDLNGLNGFGPPDDEEGYEARTPEYGAVVPWGDDEEDSDPLDFYSWPRDSQQQRLLDQLSQTPDEAGYVLCWRRKKQCRNPDCCDPATGRRHAFTKEEHDLWNCPLCGADRHCRNRVKLPNKGCRSHGGATPHGYALPQTRTGEYSAYINAPALKADYERLLASDRLTNLDDHIALLYARLMEIVKEYGGGASRDLLRQIKENRAAYKRELALEKPNAGNLRLLDMALDDMIKRGARADQVMDDWGRQVDRLARLIAARDTHIKVEGMMIDSERAWIMLAQVEETIRTGLELVARADGDVEKLLAIEAEIVSGNGSAPDPAQRLGDVLDAILNTKRRAVLSYASERFKELAGQSLDPRPLKRNTPTCYD